MVIPPYDNRLPVEADCSPEFFDEGIQQLLEDLIEAYRFLTLAHDCKHPFELRTLVAVEAASRDLEEALFHYRHVSRSTELRHRHVSTKPAGPESGRA